MKKLAIISLASALILGAGSYMLAAQRAIKVTVKGGEEKHILVNDIQKLEFVDDHNGSSIGVRITDKQGQVTFYEAENVEGLNYLHDYQIDEPGEPEVSEVSGQIADIVNGFSVTFNEALQKGTGEISVSGPSSDGNVNANINGNTLEVTLVDYAPGTYQVVIPAGYVNVGATSINSQISQEVEVLDGEVREDGGVMVYVHKGFEVTYPQTISKNTGTISVVVDPTGPGGSVSGRRATETIEGNKFTVVLANSFPVGRYIVTVPAGYLNVGSSTSAEMKYTVEVPRNEVEGEIKPYYNSLSVFYPQTITKGTGEISVSGPDSSVSFNAALNDKEISITFDNFTPGTYKVTIPAGYVYMGNSDMNKKVECEIELQAEGWTTATKVTKNRTEGNEVKMVLCLETNDINPLNANRYVLRRQHKPLWDYVVLFSGNININNPAADKGPYFEPNNVTNRGVYFHANAGIKYIIEHKDEIIKPLQERGTKVLLGIMPNHDRAALTNLSEEGRMRLVEELIQVQEQCGVDGFFWDDEYGNEGDPISSPDLLTGQSVANFALLLEEVKSALPESINFIFKLNQLSIGDSRDWGKLIDGILPNYLIQSGYWGSHYPGTTNQQWGQYSKEAAQETYYRDTWVTDICTAEDQCCLQMVFGPGKESVESRRITMDQHSEEIVKAYYDDELDPAYYPAAQSGHGSNWVLKQW